MSVFRSFALVAFAGAAVLAADPAWGQVAWPVPVEDPTLAVLIEEALSRNPDVAATRQAAVAAGQRPAQARSLPNPMVSVGYTNDGWSPIRAT